jgi:3-oxoacyl-[acyl-carrier-protein] synthase-3
MDKFYCNLERYGNTSAASIPLALNEAVQTKALSAGDLCLLVAFGAGLTWSSTIVRF